jgi:hypothetical protein
MRFVSGYKRLAPQRKLRDVAGHACTTRRQGSMRACAVTATARTGKVSTLIAERRPVGACGHYRSVNDAMAVQSSR